MWQGMYASHCCCAKELIIPKYFGNPRYRTISKFSVKFWCNFQKLSGTECNALFTNFRPSRCCIVRVYFFQTTGHAGMLHYCFQLQGCRNRGKRVFVENDLGTHPKRTFLHESVIHIHFSVNFSVGLSGICCARGTWYCMEKAFKFCTKCRWKL